MAFNDHDSELWHNRGISFWQLGQRQEAAADFQRALELNPWDGRPANNLGCLSLETSDPETALHYFTLARDLDPSDPNPALNVALALLALKRPQEALDFVEVLHLPLPVLATG